MKYARKYFKGNLIKGSLATTVGVGALCLEQGHLEWFPFLLPFPLILFYVLLRREFY